MARSGHVYVMRVDESVVKVGFSKSPLSRSRDLGNLDVAYHTGWIEKAEIVEKCAQRILATEGHHIKNELFSASLDEAVGAIERAVRAAEDGTLQMDKPRPGRRKKPVTFALDAELLSRLEAWISDQPIRVSLTAVLETALREFLEAEESGQRGR